jgi:hypothetical protein
MGSAAGASCLECDTSSSLDAAREGDDTRAQMFILQLSRWRQLRAFKGENIAEMMIV